MQAKHEYEFIANFKILQTTFKTKRIDKVRTDFTPLLSLNSAAADNGRETREMQDAVRSNGPYFQCSFDTELGTILSSFNGSRSSGTPTSAGSLMIP